jgi:hypothetical protein
MTLGKEHGGVDFMLPKIPRGRFLEVDEAASMIARLCTLYYMCSQPRFHIGDPRYEWVNRTVFVGAGERLPDAVRIGIFEVL